MNGIIIAIVVAACLVAFVAAWPVQTPEVGVRKFVQEHGLTPISGGRRWSGVIDGSPVDVGLVSVPGEESTGEPDPVADVAAKLGLLHPHGLASNDSVLQLYVAVRTRNPNLVEARVTRRGIRRDANLDLAPPALTAWLTALQPAPFEEMRVSADGEVSYRVDVNSQRHIDASWLLARFLDCVKVAHWIAGEPGTAPPAA